MNQTNHWTQLMIDFSAETWQVGSWVRESELERVDRDNRIYKNIIGDKKM